MIKFLQYCNFTVDALEWMLYSGLAAVARWQLLCTPELNIFFRAAWNASADKRRERCLSVRLSKACIVTKRKIDLSIFYTIRKII